MKNKETGGVPGKNRLKEPRLWIFLGIVALTLYVLVTQWGAQPLAEAPKTTRPPATTRKDVDADGVVKTSTVKGKKIDPLRSQDPSLMPQLEVEPTSFESEKRNLFAFYVPPPPPPPPPPKPECGDGSCNGGENYTSCAADCPPPPPPPVCGDSKCEGGESYANCPADCDPPPPPEIALKYIGYMNNSDGEVSFLTDGKEVYMGRVNDIIANRYRVIRITEEGVELGYVNIKTGQSKMIPFEGNSSEN